MTSPSWVAPRAWLSFIQLDKAVVLLWLHWLVFCEYGFSVSALWCPLATPTILLGFLLPWAWGISSWLLQQSAAIAPYLGRGVSSHCHPSWPSTWDSSSRPSCAHAATAAWTWCWSSRPPSLASGVGLLLPATAPDVLEEHLQVTCKTELGMILTKVIHWCADIVDEKPTCGDWKHQYFF